MVLVIVLGAVLLLLGLTLHQYAGRQEANIHHITSGEVAHFLAEAGLNVSVRSVRDALRDARIDGSTDNAELARLLTRPENLADTSLMPFLKDSWNEELKSFAAETDKTAAIRVEVWLRNFRQTETDPAVWADPGAKSGYLSIESAGEYKGVRRVLTVKRLVTVASILPPVVSKFTLHVADAMRGQEGRYNIIRNDYAGSITDGPRPLICLNHDTPESPLEQKPLAAALSADTSADVWQKRGWIFLGGRRVRLQITSGAGAMGEIFHFYDVSNVNTFQAIRFKTPPEQLSEIFSRPVQLPVDTDPRRQVFYNLGHGFVLEGFHDKSSRADHDAMYHEGILSTRDKAVYGAQSSQLHLFGEARKGFQSRTKVVGNVYAAFPKFATLDVTPQDPDIAAKLSALRPPAMYLLPSMPESAFDPGRMITDVLGRKTGGPILAAGLLCSSFQQYKPLMSGIIETPYVCLYNTMQDVVTAKTPRQYPSSQALLELDEGEKIELKRDEMLLYRGRADAAQAADVMQKRSQLEFSTIADFWKACLDEKTGMLQLNDLIRIHNAEKMTLTLPPAGKSPPLKVSGGGSIVLDEGDLSLRGVQMTTPADALTVVLLNGSHVAIENALPNQLNVLAPKAELSCQARMDLTGTLAIGNLPPDSRSAGGVIRYREIQDPTQSGYQRFYKIHIADRDSSWHE
ncbi:MAG TPA: hypothetical protein PKM25_03920 [Candidatus Ozemobacteraceae bacterium]|nr:hypothetical protein [Candidatus Ozemobacteraceae bacterium]